MTGAATCAAVPARVPESAPFARAQLAREAGPDRLRVLALRSRNDTVLGALADLARLGAEPGRVVQRLLTGAQLAEVSLGPETVGYTLALATAWAGMGRSSEELTAAVRVYAQVLDRCGPHALRQAEQRHLAQTAFLAGEHAMVDRALRELPDIGPLWAAGLRADLANPVVGGPGALPHAQWQQLFGSHFVDHGLAAPEVAPAGEHESFFNGLRLPRGRSVDGPLVSVVMPTYQPDEGLITSLRSILVQSHGNLEVLLVDDASGPDHEEVFARAESLDERVRVLRQEHNGGSYLARNAALAVARGEWVTTQDDDDWSHPERLAAQLAGTAGQPGAVASRSLALRCRPDLTRQWFGYSAFRMNASALMIRRDVLERLGGFDQVRKGADSEIAERLRLLGDDAMVDVTAPLAVTRLAPGSLSRADFSFGRHSPDRVLFRSTFRHWHASLAQRTAADPATEERGGPADGPRHPESALALHRTDSRSPYPVPRSFRRALPGAETVRSSYPLVVAANLAGSVPPVAGAGAERRDVLGVLGLEDLTRAGVAAPTWSDALLDAARKGWVDLLTSTDEVHAEILVCLQPTLLSLPALPLPRLTAERVLLAAVPPSAAIEKRGSRIVDLEAASATARAISRRGPVWIARDERDRATWAAEGWVLPLLAEALAP